MNILKDIQLSSYFIDSLLVFLNYNESILYFSWVYQIIFFDIEENILYALFFMHCFQETT